MEVNFGRSAPFSLGVEEEFQILDAETMALRPASDEIIAALPARERAAGHVVHELFQSTVEASTGIARTVAEAVAELAALRTRLGAIAAAHGATIASAGTHPFARWEDEEITDRPRYVEILEDYRWLAERGLVFGLHVHVGVDSAATAIACANSVRTVLPELLALSANSPFWHGRATGLASTRAKVFEGFPRTGIPPAFASFEEFESLVERAVRTGSFLDYTYIWWDVRPHPRLGTVEIRVCDAQTRLASVGAIAALVQCLVATVAEDFARGAAPPAQPLTLVEENKWRATRDGLGAQLVDLDRDAERPARQAIRELLERCEPASRRLGCARELASVEELLARGCGADEQREAFAQTGSLRAVARGLADLTQDVA